MHVWLPYIYSQTAHCVNETGIFYPKTNTLPEYIRLLLRMWFLKQRNFYSCIYYLSDYQKVILQIVFELNNPLIDNQLVMFC